MATSILVVTLFSQTKTNTKIKKIPTNEYEHKNKLKRIIQNSTI